jgi:hypothetical protein
MKKANRFLINLWVLLSAAVLFTAPFSAHSAEVLMSYPVVALPAILATTYVAYNQAMNTPVFGAITKEIWTGDIVANLYKNQQFLQYAWDDDQYVLAGKVVHIPNAGAASSVTKNRSSLPATVAKRTDVDLTYNLDEYTTDPRLIANAETVELAYDKRQSVISEDQMALNQTVAENMIINWSPATLTTANKVLTTGTATTVPTGMTNAGGTQLTGSRKLMKEADLKSMMTAFNAANVPQEDRYCLVDAWMYDQLITDMGITANREFSKYYDAEKGILGKLHTFNILMRSTVVSYAVGNSINAYAAAGVAATDNNGALCWQKNSVSRAMGDILMFDQQSNPAYYGDIYSFLLRMGGTIRRNDAKGVGVIIQN